MLKSFFQTFKSVPQMSKSSKSMISKTIMPAFSMVQMKKTIGFQYAPIISYNFSSSTNPEDFQANPYIVDINGKEDWEKVISSPVPVVLDCYATWCEPCKKLTPFLEEQARQANGDWILAKLDIDAFPQLANALQLQSVPTVVLISGGNFIDAFNGIPQDDVWNNFMQTLKKVAGLGFNEAEYQAKFGEAVQKIEAGNYGDAIQELNKLLEESQWVQMKGGLTHAVLALAHIKSGNEDGSKQSLSALYTQFEEQMEDEQVQEVIAQVEQEFENRKKGASELDTLIAQLNEDPKNLELRYKIAEAALEKQVYEEAITQLLNIVKIQRNWEDGKANQKLIEIFGQLGSTNQLVIDGRKKLSRILY